MTTLIIVESPGKVKKIGGFLGAGYRVVASVGHVRDLPLREIGVEAPDFKPHYVPTARGQEVLAKLRKAVASSDRVLLATDPDREGEAIAWHLADELKLRRPERITFTAITPEAVKAAVAQPRSIDMQLVRSQEARRILDRLIGWQVSQALSSRCGDGLSAGRVQSPAVRLVYDRERAIASFRSTEHYGVEVTVRGSSGAWKAVWDTKPHLPKDEKYLTDMDLARRVAGIKNLVVREFVDQDKNRAPAAPFTTSTLQQVAGQRLKMRPKATMDAAQKLYEQGAITYHRTDAPNMDAAGVDDIAGYARSAGLPLSGKSRKWKAKDGAQEGHEAIRPTHAVDLERGETDDEKALYRLIWQRAVASQLADAVYAVRAVKLEGELEDCKVSFKGVGRTLKSPGWIAIYKPDDDKELTASNPIPELKVADPVTVASARVQTKHTEPPPRFTETTLVGEMERLGIGRPSTYAAIIENIKGRHYVDTQKGYLVPTAAGEIVRKALVGQFKFIEFDYTRGLEELLDEIAEGKNTYKNVLAAAWSNLERELAGLESVELAGAMPVFPCPSCGKPLRRIKGKYGAFWSCSGYPDCTVRMKDADGEPGAQIIGTPADQSATSKQVELITGIISAGYIEAPPGWPNITKAQASDIISAHKGERQANGSSKARSGARTKRK